MRRRRSDERHGGEILRNFAFSRAPIAGIDRAKGEVAPRGEEPETRNTTNVPRRSTMTTTTKTGLKIKSSIKAAGFSANHNRALASGLKVKAAVKAAGFSANHNRALASGLKVKAAVKAAGFSANHNRALASF
jgi:hypothetical protein